MNLLPVVQLKIRSWTNFSLHFGQSQWVTLTYMCHILWGKIACIKQYAVFHDSIAVLILLGLKIYACSSLNCYTYLYSKLFCLKESKYWFWASSLAARKGLFQLQLCLFATSVYIECSLLLRCNSIARARKEENMLKSKHLEEVASKVFWL